MTGPSVILGYVILTPAILATSIPYAAYLSTPLGREPGGEYLHISRTVKGFRLAYVGAWLKIISYIGAGAYLANAMAGYFIAWFASIAAVSVAAGFSGARCVLRNSRHRYSLVRSHPSCNVSIEVFRVAGADRARTLCS